MQVYSLSNCMPASVAEDRDSWINYKTKLHTMSAFWVWPMFIWIALGIVRIAK